VSAEGQHIIRSDLSLHPRHFRGRHHAATIIVVLLLAVVGFRLFPEKDVTVLSNGQSYRVSTTFGPEREALAAADVELEPGDRVLSGTGGHHVSIAVQRARPVVLEVDGARLELRTQAATVAGALADAGIDLRPADRVYVDGRLVPATGPLYVPTLLSRVAATPADTATTPVVVAVERARPVTVFVDTLRVDTSTAAHDVRSVLAELGMSVREGDLVRPALDAPVTSGSAIHLAKARTITVRLDGVDETLYTQAESVADVVALLGVTLGPEDVVEPAPDTLIRNEMVVTIARTLVVEESVEEVIQPAMQEEHDPTARAGSVRVIPGEPGLRVTRFQVTYKNGAEVDRVYLGATVVTATTPTRRIVGTAAAAVAAPPTLNAPGCEDCNIRAKMTVTATWYNASHGGRSPDDPHYGLTSRGAYVDYGVCATDPAVIPMGTRFYVPDYGICTALDTGSAIKGSMVDLGFPEAVGDPGWGKRSIEIYILD
jgi:uncharacterized protein YabE (DUF348 family)/3D (Asp-Asp-Asp) domain-containing protein